MTDLPVVLIIFNRPDLVAAQLARLREVAPRHLLVVADGPRTAAEAGLCEQSRRAVQRIADWSPTVEWNVSDVNLGCGARVETGLDWAFRRVERAVIMEDDVAVAPQFFDFAAAELAAHAADRTVGSISARNVLVAHPAGGYRGSVWGWATWADRWQEYRTRRTAEADLTEARLAQQPPLVAKVLTHLHRRRLAERTGEWDITWSVWRHAVGWRCITPTVNLAANHGFRADAAHTAVTGDLRSEYPLLPEPASELALDYDHASMLLDLMMMYQHPRRWRLLARHALTRPAPNPAMDVMLEPWRHREESQAVLAHLAQFIDSPHLSELQEAFR